MAGETPRSLPSRAWSGSSMVAGVAAMNLEYEIKKEIPQEQDALNEYIQELCFCDKLTY